MNKLPTGLDVISQVEGSVFKVRQVRVRGPHAEREEEQGETADKSMAGSREPLRCRHASCLISIGPGGQACRLRPRNIDAPERLPGRAAPSLARAALQKL